MKPYGFVYITRNLLDGKKYIGQRRYTNGWKRYLGSGKHLLRAIRKHGRNAFQREIILVAFDKEFLNEMEIHYIREFDAVNEPSFYNLSDGGHGVTRGFFGKQHSVQTRAKMRLSQLGHSVSQKTKDAVSKAQKGRQKTKEAIAKQSAAISGANNFRAKSILINGIQYNTFTQAAKETGLSPREVRILAGVEPAPKRNYRLPLFLNGVYYDTIKSARNATGHSYRYIKKHGSFQ